MVVKAIINAIGKSKPKPVKFPEGTKFTKQDSQTLLEEAQVKIDKINAGELKAKDPSEFVKPTDTATLLGVKADGVSPVLTPTNVKSKIVKPPKASSQKKVDEFLGEQEEVLSRKDLSGNENQDFHLVINKRKIKIPFYSNGVAKFTFFELCGENRGPADFLAIVDNVRVLIVENIPQLGRSNFNEAKRFITFIDTVYEAGIVFICSAAAQPEYLYLDGEGVFEFERTVSRLNEMQSDTWGRSLVLSD